MAFFYLKNSASAEMRLLDAGATTIGRSSMNKMPIDSSEKSVSSHHAVIYNTGSGILVQDVGSRNGTYVNGEKITERKMAVGDSLWLGEKGPRFTLIYSEQEMRQQFAAPPPPPPIQASTSSTSVGPQGIRTATITAESPQNPFMPAGGSYTVDMENKILENNIDEREYKKIASDASMVQKLINRNALPGDKLFDLAAAHEKRNNVKLFKIGGAIFGGIILVLAIAAIILAISSPKSNSDFGTAKPKKGKAKVESAMEENLLADAENVAPGNLKLSYDTVKVFIDNIMFRLGEDQYEIPPSMIKRVHHHLGVYSGPMKSTIKKFLTRRDQYYPMMEQVFTSKKLPLELTYISMLESGYNPEALSHAGARGLWQFMPATGRNYGLRVDNNVDERTDPYKATIAASKYFSDLIAIFGGKSSIMLCMAAYNAGENRIMGALRKIDDPVHNRDFWHIYNLNLLAEETNEYIPRVISLIIIDENRSLFGLN